MAPGTRRRDRAENPCRSHVPSLRARPSPSRSAGGFLPRGLASPERRMDGAPQNRRRAEPTLTTSASATRGTVGGPVGQSIPAPVRRARPSITPSPASRASAAIGEAVWRRTRAARGSRAPVFVPARAASRSRVATLARFGTGDRAASGSWCGCVRGFGSLSEAALSARDRRGFLARSGGARARPYKDPSSGRGASSRGGTWFTGLRAGFRFRGCSCGCCLRRCCFLLGFCVLWNEGGSFFVARGSREGKAGGKDGGSPCGDRGRALIVGRSSDGAPLTTLLWAVPTRLRDAAVPALEVGCLMYSCLISSK